MSVKIEETAIRCLFNFFLPLFSLLTFIFFFEPLEIKRYLFLVLYSAFDPPFFFFLAITTFTHVHVFQFYLWTFSSFTQHTDITLLPSVSSTLNFFTRPLSLSRTHTHAHAHTHSLVYTLISRSVLLFSCTCCQYDRRYSNSFSSFTFYCLLTNSGSCNEEKWSGLATVWHILIPKNSSFLMSTRYVISNLELARWRSSNNDVYVCREKR